MDYEALDRTALKEEILALNREQLETIANICKTEFMMDYLELKNKEDIDQDDKDFLDLKEYVRLREIYGELDQIFYKMMKTGEFRYEKLVSIRNEIYQYYESLKGYYLELKHIKTSFDDEVIRSREDKLDILMDLDQRKEALLKDIEESLDDYEERGEDSSTFMSVLINNSPFKLSKYKYYDVLTRTLTHNLKDKSQDFIYYELDALKLHFNPRVNKGYGLYFDKYFTEIELMRRKEIEELDLDAIREVIDQAEELLEEIGFYMKDIKSLGILSNRLMTIGLIMEKNELEFDLDLVESYYEAEKINKELAVELNTNNMKLTKLVENFSQANEVFFEISDTDSQLDLEYNRTRKLLRYYNDKVFIDEAIVGLDEEAHLESDYTDKLIDNFIDFIRRNLRDMDVVESRIRMKSLLTVLNPPFSSKKSFLDFISYSLDRRVISDKELNLSIMSLNILLNKNKK